jgi:hypothetical protein
MVSVNEATKHARSGLGAGNVSHRAQQRVDERLTEVMARRDAALRQRRDSHSDQPFPVARLTASRP